MGCTIKCGSQGQAKGKGSLAQRVAVRGQGQVGVVQRDLFCRLLLSFVSLLEQGVGQYLLFFSLSHLSSVTGWLWS